MQNENVVSNFFTNLWKSKGEIMPKLGDITPKLSRFSLSSKWIWIFAIFINALVLVKYLAPLVLSNSLLPIILPTGIAAGLLGGINDFFGLFTAVKAVAADFSSGAKDLITIFGAFASKLGYALSATAIFILMLTAQSIYRVAHFIDQLFFKKNLKDSVKEALAITNPLLTFSIFNMIMLPWLMGHKMIIAAVVSLWVGPDIINVFANSSDVAVIVNTLAKAASAAVICIIVTHLIIVAFAYILIYKMQCRVVDILFTDNFVEKVKNTLTKGVSNTKNMFGWIVCIVVGSIFATLVTSCISKNGVPLDQDKYGLYRRGGTADDYCSVITKNNEVFGFVESKGDLYVVLNPASVMKTDYRDGTRIVRFKWYSRIFNTETKVNLYGVDCRDVVNALSGEKFMTAIHKQFKLEYSPVTFKMRGELLSFDESILPK
jgi:hypothetical protein